MHIPNFSDLLHSFSTNMPAMAQLLAGFMVLTGFVLVFRALYCLKVYGNLRTMMSTNAELKPALLYFLVGAIFIYYPTSFQASLDTVFGSSNVLSYTAVSTWSTKANQMAQDIGMILRFIGYISFFRGWILVTHLAGQTQPGTMGKAITHIIAGILLINIYGTWNVIKTTLGLG